MPIRTASLNKQIHKNGIKLHLAMATRIRSNGADHPASDNEQALLEERLELIQAEAARRVEAALPKVKVGFVAKEVKVKVPKAPKAAKVPKEAKEVTGKAKPSRADKSTKKAENAEAAKKAEKKSAAKK